MKSSFLKGGVAVGSVIAITVIVLGLVSADSIGTITVYLDANTTYDVSCIANGDDFVRITLEWDNGNGPTDVFTSNQSAPPYDEWEFASVSRDSGSSGNLNVTVEHSETGQGPYDQAIVKFFAPLDTVIVSRYAPEGPWDGPRVEIDD